MNVPVALLLGVTLGGCAKSRDAPGKPDAGVAQGSAALEAGVAHEHFANPSLRCSECHGEIATEWAASAHSHAERSPLFRAMRASAQGANCEGCHAPIRAKVPPDDPVAADSIGCDSCHLMTDITPKREGMGFVLRIDDTTRYGPLCDAKNHYFHKMGCSPVHGRSQMCSSCHLYYSPAAAGGLPVFTEFEEWEKSRYSSASECQDCHMPTRAGTVAVGAGKRGVSRHDFEMEIRRTAVSMRLAVEAGARGERVAVVTLTNDGAGHSVPTGLPEHRLVLHVELHDASDAKGEEWERSYGRVLVDEKGNEAPFYRAKRLDRDTRIAVDEARAERFPLPESAAGAVVARLEWQRVSTPIATALAVANESVALLSGRLRFDASRDGRMNLPKPVIVKP